MSHADDPRQLRARFVRDGHVVVRSGQPAQFHRDLFDKLESVFESEGNVGNNILPRVPEIGQVFEDPAVRGALTALLGPGYVMNPHRHCHLNPPGGKGQGWHKDCYVFDHNLRQPRYRWVLAFYYPQDTTADMGATGVLPGHQWYRSLSDADPARSTEPATSLTGAAGTVSIVHFDHWHRATANTSDRKRYMLKFQFVRTAEPEAGDADTAPEAWPEGAAAVCDDVWRWLAGDAAAGAGSGTGDGRIGGHVDQLRDDDPAVRARAADAIARSGAAAEALPALTAVLEDAAEAVRLNAAYALAAAGAAGLPALAESLRREALASESLTTAKTADNAHGTNPTAPVAAHALAVAAGGGQVVTAALGHEHWWVRAVAAGTLGNMGRAAAPHAEALAACLDDEHWWVRRNALEALGRAEAVSVAAEAVSRCLEDVDYRVRRNAAIALRQAPVDTEQTLPALGRMLQDENRYNRFYAAAALRRLASRDPAAGQLLLDHLFTARWCPLTTSADRY